MITSQIKKFILDILFPIECLLCHQEGLWLCKNCFERMPLENGYQCLVCGKNTFQGLSHQDCSHHSPITGLVVGLKWKNDFTKNLIHKFKFSSLKELSVPLAELLIKKIESSPLFKTWLEKNQPLIVPIPLHEKRLLERGFNQAELLASEIASNYNLILKNEILLRTKNTKPQTTLNAKKRLVNLENAFTLNDTEAIKNKNIILIDDVATTGATLNAAAQVLKKAGALVIWVAVLARG